MRVRFGYATVSRPTRVPNPDLAAESFCRSSSFHFSHAANASHTLNFAIDHGHACRIVAAVFEAT